MNMETVRAIEQFLDLNSIDTKIEEVVGGFTEPKNIL